MEVNNNSKKRNYNSSYFNGDEYRLLFLLMLYSVQGFAFGFLDITMPVSLKKYFSYSEIGIICWSWLPFSIKFLFAPFVDTYYFKWLGKKRSWIVPTQILIAAINFYISKNLDKFIEDRRYFTIALMFFLIILLLVLQDIAIDGWCLTIVKKENLDNASLTQTIGVQCGMFIGTTLFYALNSLEFCNNYIYSTKQDDPILNESKFFMFWGYFILKGDCI